MRQIRSFIVLTGAATLVACATQAPEPGSGAAHTLPSHPTPNKTELANGYAYTRVVAADGSQRYCRTTPVTGSHTDRETVCLTPAQFQDEKAHAGDRIQGVDSLNGASAGAGH